MLTDKSGLGQLLPHSEAEKGKGGRAVEVSHFISPGDLRFGEGSLS